MYIYNVKVTVDQAVENEWYRWMVDIHIPDVLSTGFFVGARILKDMEKTATYYMEYRYDSLAEMDAYQAGPAAALKKDHSDRFSGKVSAERHMAHEAQVWSHPPK